MLITIILLLLVGAFALAGLKGAPYVPVLRPDKTQILDQLDLAPGQTLIDLGSGDGRLLRAAAARGIHCIGYEINPVMVMISRLLCFRYRHLITIRLADLWHTPLPPADTIYVFLMPRFMGRLHAKLKNDITQPTTVVSYIFEIPEATAIKHRANAYFYHYPTAPQSLASSHTNV